MILESEIALQQESGAMSTPYQPIYDSALQICESTDRMLCVHCQDYSRRGREEEDRLPNQSVSVLRKARRKGRQQVKKRVVEALVATYNTLYLANVSMRVYFSFLFVSFPVSCLVHGAFLFICTQSLCVQLHDDLSLSTTKMVITARPYAIVRQ